MRLVAVTTHPIQYQAPLFRSLAQEIRPIVVFMMHQTAEGQSQAGFGVRFDWDIPLLDGYSHAFAKRGQTSVTQPTLRNRIERSRSTPRLFETGCLDGDGVVSTWNYASNSVGATNARGVNWPWRFQLAFRTIVSEATCQGILFPAAIRKV